MEQITYKELKKISKPNVIDLRNSLDYKHGSFKDAANVSSIGLLFNTKKFLNKEDTYYLMCYSGNMSSKTAMILSQRGYNVVNVLGGYQG